METYGKILTIAMPAFLLLVLLEKVYGWIFKKDAFKPLDTISSLSSGYTNVVKDVLGLSVSILSYQWMVSHWTVYKVESTIWVYIIAFIALDFSGYWVHRLSHEINFFWNKHAIHHSSEEFNLGCALRQSISSFVSLFTIFLLPAALLGVEPKVIAIVAPLHLFAQFWYHTVYIGRMGFLEKIIVTPSHHRVHHAINPEYLDKNHGQIFIFWDKIFGTFQEELPNVPPVYGITRPASTWNPIKINFQHLWLLIKDAARTKSLKDKFRIWFMPTGWRPADVAERFPVNKIEDIYHFQKYAPQVSNSMLVWIWVQFFFTFSLLYHLFGNIAKIGSPNIFIYGGFIYLIVFAYTELMDKNPYALLWEALKNVVGFYIIFSTGDWFGLSQLVAWGKPALIAYLIVSMILTSYFVLVELKQENSQTQMA
ncbi:fatty acid hydroxylase [Emticicia oligotrophica DSM 17448]|uniref:Fatty acid hydroxylase n=1 Tax=Emticicia oligotrophica (strain DSM 17448 / CIP 109782 / MTCC 6937 / GPTSA100-15) TaxID=929562 RepID=A0ABM5N472_EMTOG|nr:sterol desaturase family protein [Emticicia oligotrophica]AFK04209.1 fatty acid hydroxylase [Emticicia oligotrophica DSM 17448]